MSSSPMAIGREVEPIWPASSRPATFGASRPKSNPAAMASTIHTGKNRSSKDNPETTLCSTSATEFAAIAAEGVVAMKQLRATGSENVALRDEDGVPVE